jgi:dephospho-CoA kinase
MLQRDGPNGLTQSDAESRLASQWPLRSKLPYADVVLDNSSALASSESTTPSRGTGASPILEAQVADLVRSWRSYYSFPIGTVYWLMQWLIPPFGLAMGVWCLLARYRRTMSKIRSSEESDRRGEESRARASRL